MITLFLLRVNHRRHIVDSHHGAIGTSRVSSLSSIKTTHLLILFLTGSLKRFVVVIPSLNQFTPANLSLMCIAVVNESKLGCTQ